MEARYYHSLPNGNIQCDLCPHNCIIAPDKVGFCRVRRHVGGKLIAETYRRPAALQVDPIEKKPLAFYRPGTKTFSVGTMGCNLGCQFCQNDFLSRHGMEAVGQLPEVSPEEIVRMALESHCESVALTYNEPTVFIEYGMEIARAAREHGLGTVLVSNGYINPEPRRDFYRLIDAANIDVKGFGEFYPKLCCGTLAPVLESCRVFKKEFGGHLEITNLVIPGCNDSDESIRALLEWVERELGHDTPIHFSGYFPAGGFQQPPTPANTLYRARKLANDLGFPNVLLGNLRY